MSPLAILKAQVKRALVGEANYDPEVRELFDWRFVVNVGGKQYLVGKTGANTVYYQTPDMEEPAPCYPSDIEGIIDSWSKSKYLSFFICHKKFDNIKLDNIKTIEEALQKVPKTFHNKIYIAGVTPKGKRHKLYVLQSGLRGNTWVPLKEEAE